MGPWGQEMGEWLQPPALSRGERMPAWHKGKRSPSTPAPLYERCEGGWGRLQDTHWPLQEGSRESCIPFGEGGTQRISAGADHIIQ